jgi:hypothetical protein
MMSRKTVEKPEDSAASRQGRPSTLDPHPQINMKNEQHKKTQVSEMG